MEPEPDPINQKFWTRTRSGLPDGLYPSQTLATGVNDQGQLVHLRGYREWVKVDATMVTEGKKWSIVGYYGNRGQKYLMTKSKAISTISFLAIELGVFEGQSIHSLQQLGRGYSKR
jgi:hypothetical protein